MRVALHAGLNGNAVVRVRTLIRMRSVGAHAQAFNLIIGNLEGCKYVSATESCNRKQQPKKRQKH